MVLCNNEKISLHVDLAGVQDEWTCKLAPWHLAKLSSR